MAIMASKQCKFHTYGGKHFTRGPAHSRPLQVWSGLVGRVSVVLSLMHLLIQNGETVEAHGQQAAAPQAAHSDPSGRSTYTVHGQ